MTSSPRLARRAASLLGALVLGATLAGPALAADDTNVTVTGASLGITSATATDFPGVTLDGTAKTATATLSDFTVTDARGNGAGWHVNVSATRFALWDATLNAGAGGYVSGGHTLPASSLSMQEVTVAKNDPSSSALPSVTGGPYVIDGGQAVAIASAAADGTGMGSYDFGAADGTITLTLTVPASAYKTGADETYRSDVTVDVVSGP